jgi:HNH endonuclease
VTRTNDRTYLRNRARLKRVGVVCALCGQPIDVSLKWPDPLSFTADHVEPVALGGNNRGDLAPMHAACNRLKSTKDLDEVRPVRHSRSHY